jgi:hypothetical protein
MASPVVADKLGLESAGALLTPREFDAVGAWDEDYRYELIHGVLVVAALPLPMETGPNETLGVWLANYQMQGGTLDGTLPEQYVHLIDSRRRADKTAGQRGCVERKPGRVSCRETIRQSGEKSEMKRLTPCICWQVKKAHRLSASTSALASSAPLISLR